MPTFAFPAAPALLAQRLRRRWNAPLPSPEYSGLPRLRRYAYARLLSMPSRSTSELLRTL